MATNLKQYNGNFLSVICTSPATPVSGDPVRWGSVTGVALTDESGGGNATGYTSVDFGTRVWEMSVDDNEGAGIAIGDPIYYHDSGTGSPSSHLNNSATGANALFGFALETVSANATTAIKVSHIAYGFSTATTGTVVAGQIASDAVTTAKILDANVTVAKLAANLQIGYIPLPIAQARLIAAADIAAKNAADGGLISLDTDPTLKRVNVGTDPQLRLAWAATSVIPVQWSFAYPPDLDDTAAITLHFLAGMGGSMDTPVLGVGFFEGVGDTNAGGNTAALAQTVADKSVVIAASDVGAYPQAASVIVTPPAHANDAIYIYQAWATYQRKS